MSSGRVSAMYDWVMTRHAVRVLKRTVIPTRGRKPSRNGNSHSDATVTLKNPLSVARVPKRSTSVPEKG